jgi:hypothetical protein
MKKIIESIFFVLATLINGLRLGKKTMTFLNGLQVVVLSLFAYVSVVLVHEGFLREKYEAKAAMISKEATAMASMQSVDAAAHWAVKARNDLKVAIREEGNPITKRLAEQRNQKKYGDPIGPTYQFLEKELIKKGVSKENVSKEIIKSAGVANKTVSEEARNMKLFGVGLLIGYWLLVILKTLRQPRPKIRLLFLLRSMLLFFAGVFACMVGVWLFSQIDISTTTEIDTYIASLLGVVLFSIPMHELAKNIFSYIISQKLNFIR